MMIAKASGNTASKRHAAEDQPGLVAVPDRRDGVHHGALVLLGREPVQNADPEIEAVEQHVEEHAEPDDEGPDGNEVEKSAAHRDHSAAGGWAPGTGLWCWKPFDRLALLGHLVARPGPDHAGHDGDAGREHDQIDRHVGDQRDQHVMPGHRGADRIGRAEQAVDGPGLAADLRRGPAGQHGHEAERRHAPAEPQEPGRLEEPSS